jgi:hypothetical protein
LRIREAEIHSCDSLPTEREGLNQKGENKSLFLFSPLKLCVGIFFTRKMPVAARVINNPFEHVRHQSYTTGKTGPLVLQSVNIASMVGSIHQIALLADYAAEIFDNLQKTTANIHDRICDITTRTAVLNSQIPEIHRAVLERNVSTLVSGTKKSEVSPETQMLTPITRPRQISLRYDLMNKIPLVGAMDQYLTPEDLETKGKCANLYSNPLFFFNEWVRVENQRQQEIQEEKEKKKKEKQERKALLKKEREKKRGTLKPEKKKGLNWRDRFVNENTAPAGGATETKKSNFVIVEPVEEEVPAPTRRAMLWGKVDDNDEEDKVDESESQHTQSQPTAPAFSPPPPPPSFAPTVPPPPAPFSPAAPPPRPSLTGSSPMAPPPPPPSAASSFSSSTPGSPPPPPSGLPNSPPPPPPTPSSPSSTSEAYLSTTSTVELDDLPPPPPRRPNPFGDVSDRGNLLTSITEGKKLRSVAVDSPSEKEKATPKKPSLMDEISKGRNLKKVNLEDAAQQKKEVKPAATGLFGITLCLLAASLSVTHSLCSASTGDAVSKILDRRKFIEESESDSDDSNDEWD